MSGMFRGASLAQDFRFKNANTKLIADIKQTAPANFKKKVNMSKVNKDCMAGWISQRLTEMMNIEDDVLIGMVINMLDSKPLNPYQLQLDITGFLHKDAALFVAELWTLLLSAQNAPRGMPPELVAAAKEKILRERQAKAEQDELVRKRLQEHASKMKQNQASSRRSRWGADAGAAGSAPRGSNNNDDSKVAADGTSTNVVEPKKSGDSGRKRSHSRSRSRSQSKRRHRSRRHRSRSKSRSRSRSRHRHRRDRHRRRSTRDDDRSSRRTRRGRHGRRHRSRSRDKKKGASRSRSRSRSRTPPRRRRSSRSPRSRRRRPARHHSPSLSPVRKTIGADTGAGVGKKLGEGEAAVDSKATAGASGAATVPAPAPAAPAGKDNKEE